MCSTRNKTTKWNERSKEGRKKGEEDRQVKSPTIIHRKTHIYITKFQNHRHENILKASSKKIKIKKKTEKTIIQMNRF